MLARLHLFTEARFQFRQMRSGDRGSSSARKRSPSSSTRGRTRRPATSRPRDPGRRPRRKLLRSSRRAHSPDAAGLGNDRHGLRARRRGRGLRPGRGVVGYVYKPGGQRASTRGSSSSRTRYATSRRSPTRARFRGMSWLTPIIPELMADSAATQHKLKFFETGRLRTWSSPPPRP